jgi:putative IMPACT (imprinted ancient) family translation regulator
MTVRTLAGPGEARLEVRRSIFFGHAGPAADAAALEALLSAVRRRHPGARHVAYAWVSPDGALRSSDGGEPAGTAGRPCAAALARAGLRGAAVAVARIFGGTLLGVTGLARAYGDAAAAALAAAPAALLVPQVLLEIQVRYPELERAERALARAGAAVEAREYGEGAAIRAWVAEERLEPLRASLPQADCRVLARSLRPASQPGASSPG